MVRFLFYIMFFGVILSCSKIDDECLTYEIPTVDKPIVSEDDPAITNMRNKARQLAYVEWTPIRPMPSLTGYFKPGEVQKGIPYSSVKEKDKFIGLEVSFHTFMTAVNNPRSILYTDNVRMPPYVGENCGAYYGTVCSMAVNYALGIDYPVQSDMYIRDSSFAKVSVQAVDGMYSGDILLSEGHVVLVLEVMRDENERVQKAVILESMGKTFISEYGRDDIIKRWEKDNWILVRYLDLAMNISYEPIDFYDAKNAAQIEFHYNPDICVQRGDKACFSSGEEVVINILNNEYSKIEVYREGILYSVADLTGIDVTLSDYPSGLYQVCAVNGTKRSDYTYFEIIDVKVTTKKKSKGTIVSFDSNMKPCYIVICRRDGYRHDIYHFSEEDLILRQKTIRKINSDEYVKVFFQGKYGKVSNAIDVS